MTDRELAARQLDVVLELLKNVARLNPTEGPWVRDTMEIIRHERDFLRT